MAINVTLTFADVNEMLGFFNPTNKASAPVQLQQFEVGTTQTQATSPATATPASETGEKSKFDQIMMLLEDPRYTLRTVASMSEKTGLSVFDIMEILTAHGVEFVELDRRSDGAPLIGLACRS